MPSRDVPIPSRDQRERSIRRRLCRVVDHEDFDRPFGALQFQPVRPWEDFCGLFGLRRRNSRGWPGWRAQEHMGIRIFSCRKAPSAAYPRTMAVLCSRLVIPVIRSLSADMRCVKPVAMGISEFISASEWEGLRQLFVEEGIRRSQELLAVPAECLDALQIGGQMHEWAGVARQLGFHIIAEMALRAERSLKDVPVWNTNLREWLRDLLLAFCHLRDSRKMPVPDHLAEALRGKAVALVGFPAEQANRACAALGRVAARPRLFTVTDNLEAESVRGCDLVVVRVGPGTDVARLRVAAEGSAVGKLLLVGGRGYLMTLPKAIHALVAEYLVENWEVEELLLRLAVAVSRKETAACVAAPTEFHARDNPEQPRRALTNPTVLIVDDDPIVLTLLRSTLRSHGLRCETVDNSCDALRLIREERPHLVVLDVNMPGMDGYAVLSAVRAEKLPTLVVLLTARQREEDVLRGFQLGADDYLVKPFSPPELVARIQRLLILTAKTAA